MPVTSTRAPVEPRSTTNGPQGSFAPSGTDVRVQQAGFANNVYVSYDNSGVRYSCHVHDNGPHTAVPQLSCPRQPAMSIDTAVFTTRCSRPVQEPGEVQIRTPGEVPIRAPGEVLVRAQFRTVEASALPVGHSASVGSATWTVGCVSGSTYAYPHTLSTRPRLHRSFRPAGEQLAPEPKIRELLKSSRSYGHTEVYTWQHQ